LFVLPLTYCRYSGGDVAHSKSAEKRYRQSLKRRERNRGVRSLTRSTLRKAFVAIETEPASAGESLREAASVLDRAAKKGVLHPNNVARRKARLMARHRAALAAAAEPVSEAAPKAGAKRRRVTTKAKATAKATTKAKAATKAKAKAETATKATPTEKKPRARVGLSLRRRKKEEK
jgi:small subunit ribosomal protein S20